MPQISPVEILALVAGGAAVAGTLAPGEVHPEAALVVVPTMLLAAAGVAVLGGFSFASVPAVVTGVAWLVLAGLSAAASEDRDAWKRAWCLLVAGAASALLGARLRSPSSRRILLVLLLIVGSLVVAWGLYQPLYGFAELRKAVLEDAGLQPLERQLYLDRLSLQRPFASFPLPGLLAAFLLGLMFPSAGAALDGTLSLPLRLAAMTVSLGAVVLLVITASLAGLLVAACVLAVFAMGHFPVPNRRRAALVVTALFLVALGFVALRRHGREGYARGSLGLRAANWRAALLMARDAPWLGVGPGCFGDYYPRYMPPHGNNTRHAHSFLMRVLAEQGIVAALVLVVILALAGGSLLARLRKRMAELPRLAEVGFTLGAMALGVHALLDLDLDIESLGLYTPFMVGFALAPSEDCRSGSWWGRASCALVVIAVAVPYVEHMRSLALVTRAGELARAADRAGARELLSKAIEADPSTSLARLLLARELDAVGEREAALALLVEARRLSPERGSIHGALALLHEKLGDRDAARREATIARLQLPNDPAIRGLWERLAGASPAPRH